DLLVRIRERVAGDHAERRLLDTWPDSGQERGLEDRREHHTLVHELLDAMQHRLPPLRVDLHGLLAEEAVDVRVAAVGADAARDDEGFDPGRRVAGRRAALPHEVPEALFLVGLVECRALERPELCAPWRGSPRGGRAGRPRATSGRTARRTPTIP